MQVLADGSLFKAVALCVVEQAPVTYKENTGPPITIQLYAAQPALSNLAQTHR